MDDTIAALKIYHDVEVGRIADIFVTTKEKYLKEVERAYGSKVMWGSFSTIKEARAYVDEMKKYGVYIELVTWTSPHDYDPNSK